MSSDAALLLGAQERQDWACVKVVKKKPFHYNFATDTHQDNVRTLVSEELAC
jgi:hypothetical protein